MHKPNQKLREVGLVYCCVGFSLSLSSMKAARGTCLCHTSRSSSISSGSSSQLPLSLSLAGENKLVVKMGFWFKGRSKRCMSRHQ